MTPYRAPPEASPVDRDATPLAWRPRVGEAREAVALVAEGAVALALRARLLRRSDEALEALRGVCDRRHLVLLGAAAALPWVDGVRYLGRCADAPSLVLPTTLDLDAPSGLVERALARRLGARAAPFALWASAAGRVVVCPLAEARPLSRARLAAWELRP